MLTGDGIERVLEEQSHPALHGGEGGSVLQALGSKAEERAKRRKEKKDSYALYLKGETWKKIRARVLARDKRRCLACRGRAQVVHHIQYPKNLGEERLEWLYSLCVSCHDEIHRAAQKMPLRKATKLMLDCPPQRDGTTVYLPDDQQLSKEAARTRQRKGRKQRPSKKRKLRSKPVYARSKKKQQLADDNARLHEIQRRAREKRAARR